MFARSASNVPSRGPYAASRGSRRPKCAPDPSAQRLTEKGRGCGPGDELAGRGVVESGRPWARRPGPGRAVPAPGASRARSVLPPRRGRASSARPSTRGRRRRCGRMSGTTTSSKNSSQKSAPPLIRRITPQGDARLRDRHAEPREPAMLRDAPVGAGQAQAPVGEVGERAPHLGAVEDPRIAVTGGPRPDTGEVGSSRRLGEELHPQLFAREHARQVPPLEVLRGVGQHDVRADPNVVEPESEVGQLVAGRLLVEGPLVRRVRPCPPYSTGQVIPAYPASNSAALLGRSLSIWSRVYSWLPRRLAATDPPFSAWRDWRRSNDGPRGETRRGRPVRWSSRRPPSEAMDPADSLSVPRRVAVEHPVDGEPPQIEVQVVFPGEADAAVGLLAGLRDRDAGIADVRLGDAGDLRSGGSRSPTAWAAAVAPRCSPPSRSWRRRGDASMLGTTRSDDRTPSGAWRSRPSLEQPTHRADRLRHAESGGHVDQPVEQ